MKLQQKLEWNVDILIYFSDIFRLEIPELNSVRKLFNLFLSDFLNSYWLIVCFFILFHQQFLAVLHTKKRFPIQTFIHKITLGNH